MESAPTKTIHQTFGNLFINKNSLTVLGFLLVLLLVQGCQVTEEVTEPDIPPKEQISEREREALSVDKKLNRFMETARKTGDPVLLHQNAGIQQFSVKENQKLISIEMNEAFSFKPFRPGDAEAVKKGLKNSLGEKYASYEVEVTCLEQPIEALIPNFYRNSEEAYDFSRLPYKDAFRPIPLVRNANRPYEISKGLQGRYIAAWHSHGWYYSNDTDRWEWQRPRLFQTVEDLLTMSYIVPFLTPMLENAGGKVILPRERDTQEQMVLIDNDGNYGDGPKSEFYQSNGNSRWTVNQRPGFAIGDPPYDDTYNPFTNGTSLEANARTNGDAVIEYRADIPKSGTYSVYISYSSLPESVPDARYTVHHAGGTSSFRVNQRIGGGTWIHLGRFPFRKGADFDSAKVVLTNESQFPDGIVTADAIRIGGGMGLISRGGRTSGRPRYVEGARYYLQFAGVPDSVYNIHEGKDDYTDDYQSRGDWVNYLMSGYSGNQTTENIFDEEGNQQGLGIPVDVSLAVHTDAGITETDSVVGTLAIYSLEGHESDTLFPNGQSRMANRDLTDLLQSNIVGDIRALLDSAWSRRSLYEAGYSEAYRPNTSASLLELLSHQNFADMKYAMDPRFRFLLARSIYKGILKHIATQNRTEYVVQPLPVSNFRTFITSNNQIRLRWEASKDSLEPTATPDRYMVYMSKNDEGFDNGRLVETNEFIFENPEPGTLYNFKVTAINDGGESFPSEVLSAGISGDKEETVLVVNAFDRISAPAVIDKDDFRGFANFKDEGVPYKQDIHFTGEQYNFDPDEGWSTNDKPGHGASYGDFETEVIAGNTFDYTISHGRAIMNAGYNVVSSSDESIFDRQVDMTTYSLADIILGEEKTTYWHNSNAMGGPSFEAFPDRFIDEMKRYLERGGRVFISGAYTGTDLFEDGDAFSGEMQDSLKINFAENWLKFRHTTNHAARKGDVFTSSPKLSEETLRFTFNKEHNRQIYRVEAPDALNPVHRDSSEVLIRYDENRFSAAVGYRNPEQDDYRVISMGFPFETITSEANRNRLMSYVLNYLTEELE